MLTVSVISNISARSGTDDNEHIAMSVQITSRTPFANGAAFGTSGAYETIRGTITFQNPTDPSLPSSHHCFSKTNVEVNGLPSALVPLAVVVMVFPSFEILIRAVAL